MNKNKILIFFLVLATNVFASPEDKSLELLHDIWVPTTLTSVKEANLKFTASDIIIDQYKKAIHFIEPRIKSMGIRPSYLYCIETTTNWLGYDKCIKMQEVANARHLCDQLGYGETIKTHFREVSNNTFLKIWGSEGLDSDKWYPTKTASMLSPAYKVKIIQDFSCHLY